MLFFFYQPQIITIQVIHFLDRMIAEYTTCSHK